MIRKNYFIFATRNENFPICLRHCIYSADVSNPNHRGIANAKEGDLALLYVFEPHKTFYGLFEIEAEVESKDSTVKLAGVSQITSEKTNSTNFKVPISDAASSHT